MNREVFLSLLALDAYNRGYGQNLLIQSDDSTSGVNEIGRKIGTATIIEQRIDAPAQAAGFYAIAYDWNEPADGQVKTVISYRGKSARAYPNTATH